MRTRKIIRFSSVFIISIVAAAMVLTGLIFFHFSDHFSDSTETFEQKGNLAFKNSSYAKALHYWQNIPESSRTAILCEKIGSAYLKLSNLDQANIFFKEALKKNPLNIDIQKKILRISLLKGDLEEAEKILSLLKKRSASDSDILILSGDVSLLKEDIEKAEIDYRLAMELSPTKIRPIVKLAICLHQLKRESEAKQLTLSIKRVERPIDLMLIADYYLLLGEYSKAEKFILKAVKKDPGNLNLQISLSNFYRSAGMLDKAQHYLTDLADRFPDRTEFKLMLADICLSSLDIQKTEQWLDNINEMKDDSVGYHLLKGKLWMFKGRYSHAVSSLKAALDRDYGLKYAHFLLGIAYLAGGQDKLAETALVKALMIDPNYIDTLLAMAALHYKNKNYALALQYIDRISTLESSNPTAWQIKGLCFLEQGDPMKASKAFSNAWYSGGNLSSLFLLGRSFESLNMNQAALETYESVLEKNPLMVDSLFYYTGLLAHMGKEDQSLYIINQWLGKGINLPAVYYAGAKISLELNKFSTCKVFIETAMKHELASGEFYILKAQMHRKKKEDKKIEQTLQLCTQKFPQFIKGWLSFADFYMDKQDIDRVKEVLEKAIIHFPNQPEIIGNLAWILLEKKENFDRALDLARNAYDRMPGQAWLMDTLGWAYYHKQAYTQADWMLAQAEEKSKNNGLVLYHRGMVFYKQGKLLKAKDKFKSALSFGLDVSIEESINNMLTGLGIKTDSNNEKKFIMFNTDETPTFDIPGDIYQKDQEEDDILKPDWSKLN